MADSFSVELISLFAKRPGSGECEKLSSFCLIGNAYVNRLASRFSAGSDDKLWLSPAAHADERDGGNQQNVAGERDKD
jgi:hypothetical protein